MSSPIETPSTFRLRRRTPGSFVLVPSPRLGRSIRCQGQLEAAAAVVLSACPTVVAITEQPCALWYAWRKTAHGEQFQLLAERPRKRRGPGCRFSYVIPDFLVEFQDGSRRLIEVKPSHRLDNPLVRRKLAVAATYAALRRWSYHILTERELLPGPLLANLRLIAQYRTAQQQPLPSLIARVAALPRTIRELIPRGNGSEKPLRAAVWHLLASGQLDCDPRFAPLDDETLVYPGGTIAWDPFDSVWAPPGCSTDALSGSSANWPPSGSSPAT